MRYCQIQLDRLKKTNVFNATFHIWYKIAHIHTAMCNRLCTLYCVKFSRKTQSECLLTDSECSLWRHSGQFGTINNFRLGRLPSVPVEWNEINAAWGQTVLLLHALANKMGLRFKRFSSAHAQRLYECSFINRLFSSSRYRLVPYGNHSYLESLTDKSKVLICTTRYCITHFW